jgi:hypothetical protein
MPPASDTERRPCLCVFVRPQSCPSVAAVVVLDEQLLIAQIAPVMLAANRSKSDNTLNKKRGERRFDNFNNVEGGRPTTTTKTTTTDAK